MPVIFVNTDNSDESNKLYTAKLAGDSAAKAEKRMERAVKGVFDKEAGFTTAKSNKAKGFTLRLEVANIEKANNQTKCKLSGSIVRYPSKKNVQGQKGEEMVSTDMTGNGVADGTSEASMLDCIEAIAEKLAIDSIPIMRKNKR